MELSKINSLVELFFTKYKELNSTSNKPFLKWLKDNKKDFLTWKQVEANIQILSEYLRKNLSKGDRCILLSENRPEWLISDIAIMNAGGVTVPLFTTYSEKDYEYIIDDCRPSIVLFSNNESVALKVPSQPLNLGAYVATIYLLNDLTNCFCILLSIVLQYLPKTNLDI